jgi:type IV secretory pathway VirB2 component (pilin)
MNYVEKYGPGISVAAVIGCVPYGIMLVSTGRMFTGSIDIILGIVNLIFLFTIWRNK